MLQLVCVGSASACPQVQFEKGEAGIKQPDLDQLGGVWVEVMLARPVLGSRKLSSGADLPIRSVPARVAVGLLVGRGPGRHLGFRLRQSCFPAWLDADWLSDLAKSPVTLNLYFLTCEIMGIK